MKNWNINKEIIIVFVILGLLLIPPLLSNSVKIDERIDIKIENWTNYDLHIVIKKDYTITVESFTLYSGMATIVHTYEKGYHLFSIDAFDDILYFTAYDTHYTDRDFTAIIHSSGKISFYDTGKSTSENNGGDTENEGEGCFIATAAYGTDTTKGLDTLRAFRDNVLLNNPYGKILVRVYYSTSPPIANSLSSNEYVKTATKVMLITPATIITGAIMNPIGIVVITLLALVFIFLSLKFGLFYTTLRATIYAIILLLLEVNLVFVFGWASTIWIGFSTIAIFLLPIILLTPIGIFILILERDIRQKNQINN